MEENFNDSVYLNTFNNKDVLYVLSQITKDNDIIPKEWSLDVKEAYESEKPLLLEYSSMCHTYTLSYLDVDRPLFGGTGKAVIVAKNRFIDICLNGAFKF